MLNTNRSIPAAVALPELAYPDVVAAADWLCRAFGFSMRRRADDLPLGERQYGARDFAGHHWVFTQSVADVDPASWGGELHAESDFRPHGLEDS